MKHVTLGGLDVSRIGLGTMGNVRLPGTKRVARVEENTAADDMELSTQQIERLDDLTRATGDRHDEANMSTIDR